MNVVKKDDGGRPVFIQAAGIYLKSLRANIS